MSSKLRNPFSGVVSILLVGCGSDGAGPPKKEDRPTVPSEVAQTMESAMDRSAAPCEDFYRYACGGWLDTTKLAANQVRKGRAFSMAADSNEARLDAIMQDAVDHAGSDADKMRVKAIFGSCIDEAAIDAEGITPLASYFEQIDGAADVAALMGVLGRLQSEGVPAFLGVSTFVLPDGNTALILDQEPFPLGDKDAYLRDDATSASLRDAYVGHVARVLELAGDTPDSARAGGQVVLELETSLAKVALSPADYRNLGNLYHPMDLAGLKESTPDLPWDRFLEPLGLSGLTATINVTAPPCAN